MVNHSNDRSNLRQSGVIQRPLHCHETGTQILVQRLQQRSNLAQDQSAKYHGSFNPDGFSSLGDRLQRREAIGPADGELVKAFGARSRTDSINHSESESLARSFERPEVITPAQTIQASPQLAIAVQAPVQTSVQAPVQTLVVQRQIARSGFDVSSQTSDSIVSPKEPTPSFQPLSSESVEQTIAPQRLMVQRRPHALLTNQAQSPESAVQTKIDFAVVPLDPIPLAPLKRGDMSKPDLKVAQGDLGRSNLADDKTISIQPVLELRRSQMNESDVNPGIHSNLESDTKSDTKPNTQSNFPSIAPLRSFPIQRQPLSSPSISSKIIQSQTIQSQTIQSQTIQSKESNPPPLILHSPTQISSASQNHSSLTTDLQNTIQRYETGESPIVANPSNSVLSPPPAVQSSSQGMGEGTTEDISNLVDQVSRIMARQLAVERERRGF